MELKVPDDHMVMCMHTSGFWKRRMFILFEELILEIRAKILTMKQTITPSLSALNSALR